VYGIYTQGSQAAIEYLTRAERLPALHTALAALAPDPKTPPPYFQALLQTTVENSVPGKASLVAVRAVSNCGFDRYAGRSCCRQDEQRDRRRGSRCASE